MNISKIRLKDTTYDIVDSRIGTLSPDKTVVLMIQDAKQEAIVSATYDDTNLINKVNNNEAAIALLNRTDGAVGSIKRAINDAISAIIDSAPSNFDTLREISEWIASDTTSTANIILDIVALQNALPSNLSDLSDDSTHRLVTDDEKIIWNSKQDQLLFDSEPLFNSENIVKSGGIYNTLLSIKNDTFEEFYKDRTSDKRLCMTAMASKRNLSISDGVITSSSSSNYYLNYIPCTSGEYLEFVITPSTSGVTNSAGYTVGFCNSVPAAGINYTTLKTKTETLAANTDISFKIVAPANGYIFIRYFKTYWDKIELYRWYDFDITNEYTPATDITLNITNGYYIDADEASPTFGDRKNDNFSTSSYGTSDFVDISNYSYIKIRNYQRDWVRIHEHTVGSVFYDENKTPISTALFIQAALVTNLAEDILIEVPNGIKYLRVCTLTTDAAKLLKVWTKEKINESVYSRLNTTINTVDTISSRVDNWKKFEGLASGYELRNGTPRDSSNTRRVASKYVLPVNKRKIIWFYTDRPNTEGCVYRWGYRTYSTSSGATYTNENISASIRYENATFGNTCSFLKFLPGENGWAVEIAEFDATTGELQTLRADDFTGYSLFIYTQQLDTNLMYDLLKYDILELNPYQEIILKWYSANKAYASSSSNDTLPVVIAHLSDTHGGWENVSRFIEFTERYPVDASILTGDIVQGSLTTEEVDGLQAIDRIGKVMLVIGNHDTSHYYKASGEDRVQHHWREYINLPAYDAYIAPHVVDWGVTQPVDAATNGYCYYYKDFVEKNLRLICVDIMGYDSTQDTWLRGLLTEALTAGPLDANNNPTCRHVLIATHFAGCRKVSERNLTSFEVMNCSYSTNTISQPDSDDFCTYSPNGWMMTDSVDDFIDAGGKFAGYIAGHFHRDYIAKVYNARNIQMIYGIDTSIGLDSNGHDFYHNSGTRMIDSFLLVSVTTVLNTVKLYKIGALIDRYAKRHEMIAINYVTGKIKSEFTPDDIPTNISAFTNDSGYLTSHQDITGKEDKVAIDSTAKTASFTASVGNYYTVNIPASTTLTITLATPSDNTKVSSCVFFVTTQTGSQIGYTTQNSTPYYTAAGATVEAAKVYEINALWNGTAWCIAQVELEAPSA